MEGNNDIIKNVFFNNKNNLIMFFFFFFFNYLKHSGSYFVRQIEQSIMRGILNNDVNTRFLYYVSDIPLDLKSTLSKSLSPWEGKLNIIGL